MAGDNTTQQQLEALAAELRTKRKDLKQAAQDERSAKADLNSAITRIAQTECLELCELMRRKLPAELRELVYRYTCTEDQPIPVGPYYHFRQYEYSPLVKERLDLELWRDILGPSPNSNVEETPISDEREDYITLPDGRLKYDHSTKVPSHIIMPNYHMFDEEYAGATIAREARGYYYSNNIFSLCNLDDGIGRFLQLARFVSIRGDRIASYEEYTSSGKVKPIDLVRDLQIRLKFEHFKTFMNTAMEFPFPTEEYAFGRNFLRNARRDLNVLHSIPVHTRTLNIEFIIMTSLDYADGDSWVYFTNMLQSLRNDIYSLMYDRDDTSIKVIHHDDGLTPFPRNLTRLWSLTKDQWKQEKAVNAERNTKDLTSDFYVGETVTEQGTVRGIPRRELSALVKERWGIEELFEDTEPRWPITEGRYWPAYPYASL